MCGISGAFGYVDDDVVQAVETMNASQRHRGPDGDGFMTEANERQGVVLAHRRLAIIDLSDDARQPMVDPESGLVITYNGELYNYKELRAELEHAGVRFTTASDTEVVLKAYRHWRESCLERLRGMFAFAIWDPGARQLFLARDRLGIKPLYLCTVPGGEGRTLLFASEVRTLLASGRVERKLDPVGLSTYLWNGFVVGPRTAVRGIELVPAGSSVTVDLDGLRQTRRRYWQMPAFAGGQADTGALSEELRQAVAMRLVSDVPLAVFLSGGVDSSVVAALASRARSEPVKTFNIGFEEAEFDESPYAERVASSLGTRHERLLLSEAAFLDGLDGALQSLDQPTYDAINSYFVSRAVREAGITVALAGTGGDELFGGYTSFRDIPRALPWGRRLGFLPRGVTRGLARAAARYHDGPAGEVPSQVRWGKLGDVFAARGDLVRSYQVSYGKFTSEFLRELHDGSADGTTIYGLPEERADELSQLVRGRDALSAISILELQLFIGERLLRDTDSASMAVSLEVRVPLLDHGLIGAVSDLNPDVRYATLGSKALLKEMVADQLPRDIFDRPKSGFVLPIERWCRRGLASEVEGLLLDRSACAALGLDHDAVQRLWRSFQSGSPGIHWSRVWGLFVLMRWCGQHGVTC